MKHLPADETCIRTGFLCTKCEEKLEKGEITPFELDLSKDFLELQDNGNYTYLKDVSFYNAIDYEDVVILIVGKNDKIRITDDLTDWVKETYQIDKLIFIEKTDKPRPVVENLIAPGKLISINEIFLATGDIEYRAVIPQQDKKKILFTKGELEELVEELTGKAVRIEFV